MLGVIDYWAQVLDQCAVVIVWSACYSGEGLIDAVCGAPVCVEVGYTCSFGPTCVGDGVRVIV